MKISSRIVTIERTPIFYGKESISSIDRVVNALKPSGTYILVDRNTREYCLPLLLEKSVALVQAQIIETGDGETAKSLENAERLWNELLASGADRSGLIINLGGGVVTDLGGFVAAGFNRGINYINIPTSLIGQSDAAIGGKTAVNLGRIKNQVGFFHPAKAIFIYPGFLKSLPEQHLRSGLAEIIKSTLISDAAKWRRLLKYPLRMLLDLPVDSKLWQNLIFNAVNFKNKVVTHDFRERKHRKILNFGHTIGHALEAYAHSGAVKPLIHGDAVAIGMICASYLSHRKTGLELNDLESITRYLVDGFPSFPIETLSLPAVMELMKHDKKKSNGHIRFTLLSKPGHPLINMPCEPEEILEALEYYNTILNGSTTFSA